MKTKPEKESTFDNFSSITEELLKSWNSQENPPKQYIAGRRVHHGTVGTILTGAGLASVAVSLLSEDEKTKRVTEELSQIFCGIGIPLMVDDINDAPEWFRFRRQEEDFQNRQTDF